MKEFFHPFLSAMEAELWKRPNTLEKRPSVAKKETDY